MTLEQWAYAAEIIGVIVVIASLVYVSQQLRQNTLAVQSAAAQGMHDQIHAVNVMLDGPMLELWLKSEDPTSLSPLEIAQLQTLHNVIFQAYQNLWFQVRSGVIDTGQAEGWWQEMRQNLEPPFTRAVWEQRNFILSQEFRDFVDDQVLTRELLQGASIFDNPIE